MIVQTEGGVLAPRTSNDPGNGPVISHDQLSPFLPARRKSCACVHPITLAATVPLAGLGNLFASQIT